MTTQIPEGSNALNVATDQPIDGDAELMKRRLQAIHNYMDESLREKRPEQAALGAVTADLMWLQLQFRRNIGDVLMTCDSPAENLGVTDRAIDTTLKVARQIDRFANLRRLLAEDRGNGLLSKPR